MGFNETFWDFKCFLRIKCFFVGRRLIYIKKVDQQEMGHMTKQ